MKTFSTIIAICLSATFAKAQSVGQDDPPVIIEEPVAPKDSNKIYAEVDKPQCFLAELIDSTSTYVKTSSYRPKPQMYQVSCLSRL